MISALEDVEDGELSPGRGSWANLITTTFEKDLIVWPIVGNWEYAELSIKPLWGFQGNHRP